MTEPATCASPCIKDPYPLLDLHPDMEKRLYAELALEAIRDRKVLKTKGNQTEAESVLHGTTEAEGENVTTEPSPAGREDITAVDDATVTTDVVEGSTTSSNNKIKGVSLRDYPSIYELVHDPRNAQRYLMLFIQGERHELDRYKAILLAACRRIEQEENIRMNLPDPILRTRIRTIYSTLLTTSRNRVARARKRGHLVAGLSKYYNALAKAIEENKGHLLCSMDLGLYPPIQDTSRTVSYLRRDPSLATTVTATTLPTTAVQQQQQRPSSRRVKINREMFFHGSIKRKAEDPADVASRNVLPMFQNGKPVEPWKRHVTVPVAGSFPWQVSRRLVALPIARKALIQQEGHSKGNSFHSGDSSAHVASLRALVRVRLASGVARSAWHGCHISLLQLYNEVDQAERKDIPVEHRDCLAALWCLYAQILFETGTLDGIDKTSLPSLAWKALALDVLKRCEHCPLVGNHPLIAVTFSRLVSREEKGTALRVCYEAKGRYLSQATKPKQQGKDNELILDYEKQMATFAMPPPFQSALRPETVSEQQLLESLVNVRRLPSLLSSDRYLLPCTDTGLLDNEIDRLQNSERAPTSMQL